ncbi:MAG: SDR family NAD(P)-dependent oxidoreductase, partial [Chloroflexi bacterium]|nr:SDR family NAD(P)-dependent oxidoreductase [Chloroflexota bacterium]
MRVLKGKVALITGGSRGIGQAIARELASRGVAIAFNYFRNPEAARAAVMEFGATGVRCLRVRAHLGEPDAIKDLFAKV